MTAAGQSRRAGALLRQPDRADIGADAPARRRAAEEQHGGER